MNFNPCPPTEMDVHCSTCLEPWDTHHLTQEAIYDTDPSEEEALAWRKLPSDQRLPDPIRDQFLEAGWQFGRSLMNVIHCPACPMGALPDADILHLKAELEDMLPGDPGALAAQYEELGL